MPEDVTIEDALLRLVVSDYTREAGVRQLERELGTVLRKTATRVASGDAAEADRRSTPRRCEKALGRPKFVQEAAARTAVPGVATGLAVTGAGGDVLFVEGGVDGRQGSGLVLTGQLGDVMKESARIALTYVRATPASSASRTARSTDASSTCTCRPARSRRTARARASRWSRRWRRC